VKFHKRQHCVGVLYFEGGKSFKKVPGLAIHHYSKPHECNVWGMREGRENGQQKFFEGGQAGDCSKQLLKNREGLRTLLDESKPKSSVDLS